LLRARLAACLDKKAMRDAEQEHLKTIQQTQVRLSKELSEAAHYVRSLFPEPAQEPLRVDWKYQPSGELGGDAFGYHWIDDQHFAIYLLDVCGHGVGAALLSAAAINVIRMGSLPNTDFRDPSSVLFSLNNTFMMEKQNNMFFTIWYGVFHVPSRKLSHAAGGHPPALLLSQDASGGKQLQQVLSPGLLIGAVGDMTYDAETITVPEDARLLVFSDGCYEIQKSDGHVMTFAEYEEFMATHGWQDRGLDELLEWCYQRHGPGALEDDFSILRVRF
jgi:sigma-B regulation protein RsbU (phosphoserine phosphatase)